MATSSLVTSSASQQATHDNYLSVPKVRMGSKTSNQSKTSNRSGQQNVSNRDHGESLSDRRQLSKSSGVGPSGFHIQLASTYDESLREAGVQPTEACGGG